MEVLIWIILSIVIGVVASNKGRSGIGWFFLSVIISPLLSGILILCCKDELKEAEQARRDKMQQEIYEQVMKHLSKEEHKGK